MIDQVKDRIKHLEEKIAHARNGITLYYSEKIANAQDFTERRTLDNKKEKEIFLATRDDIATLKTNKEVLNVLLQSGQHGYYQ